MKYQNLFNALNRVFDVIATQSEMDEIIRAHKSDELFIKEHEGMLSVDYLMLVHPHLKVEEATELLEFCKQRTVDHKSCYGDGRIMYLRWLESSASFLTITVNGFALVP